MPNYLKSGGWAVPFLLLASTLCAAQAPMPEPVTDQETELGQAVYNQLKEKGEIVEFLAALRDPETDRRRDF